MNATEIVETGLGSIGRIKILKALSEEPRMLTIYALQKKTRLKREDIKKNLRDLKSIGWINESRLANAVYSLNRSNEYVTHLTTFFLNIGYVKEYGY
jgi:DNA-binding MarR family transcriptional regulator